MVLRKFGIYNIGKNYIFILEIRFVGLTVNFKNFPVSTGYDLATSYFQM